MRATLPRERFVCLTGRKLLPPPPPLPRRDSVPLRTKCAENVEREDTEIERVRGGERLKQGHARQPFRCSYIDNRGRSGRLHLLPNTKPCPDGVKKDGRFHLAPPNSKFVLGLGKYLVLASKYAEFDSDFEYTKQLL